MRERESFRYATTRSTNAHAKASRKKQWKYANCLQTRTRNRTVWQLVRFGLVGCLNTAFDLLVLNGLLQLWPTQNIARLLLFNTIAYACGALNSFALNKYWTFQCTGRPKACEGVRFLLMTLATIGCNDLILWFMGTILYPAQLSVTR